jgi:hypothetical protein
VPVFRRKLNDPPSGITGPLRVWLQGVVDHVNNTPTLSYFSGTSPIVSAVTGMAGDLAFNVGSASTSTRLWENVGTSLNTVNWVAIRILA